VKDDNNGCRLGSNQQINLSAKERRNILENPNLTTFRRKLLYSSIMLYQLRRKTSVPFPLAI